MADLHLPSSVEIAKSDSGILSFLLLLHFSIAFLVLYFFFRPKTTAGILAIAGLSIIWGIL
jgi:hypothetical protein